MKVIKLKKKERTSITGIWRFTLEDIYTGSKRIYEYKNIIPTSGRNNIARTLAGAFVTAAESIINFTSLGTGLTAPNNSDTQLETETFRKSVASSTSSANQLFITAFYTAVEVTGTFKEAGLHINGTASPDTGVLFSRVAIDITKSATEALTIDYIVTIT